MSGRGPAWATPRAVERAHKLWLDGVPTAEIARQVRATSKSAVIGFAHRAGWPGRPNPAKLEPKSVPVKPPAHGKRSAAACPLALIAAPPPVRTCQWVIAEGKRGQGWAFCGAPSVPGRSWCPTHLRRVYERPRAAGHFALSWLGRAA